MPQMKKKGQSGVKKAFITRRKAMQKLQLSLKDFRRLCILKGVYPVQPKNKSKVSGGSSQNKTYYILNDIQYLLHEPLIWKFWDFKIFIKKLIRSKGRKDFDTLKQIKENQEFYKLDHLVKERYPTFIDALRDIDDALSMCFLYANFTKSSAAPKELVELSRRLTVEFMHYVIESKSLRKVFISIKGYYYQAEIMGQAINWVVPHQFVLGKVYDVDFRVMRTFSEFYVTLLGFVNYKLYRSQNLYYPPKTNATLSKEEIEMLSGEDGLDVTYEIIAAMNTPLLKEKAVEEEIVLPDEFEDPDGNETGTSTFHDLTRFQSLFKGLKFYVNREVPRESVVFLIRCFGGDVSWDAVSCVGSTYGENEKTITHHIVDRETITNKYINRYYIQPQWVYDCINARTLLPVDAYFPGIALPSHLSPFVEEKEGDYVPPERLAFIRQEYANEKEVDDEENKKPEKMVDEQPELPDEEEKNERRSKMAKMKVKAGKVEKKDKKQKAEASLKAEEKRLAVMMIPKKNKRLYDKIMFGKKRKVREANKLQHKRDNYEKMKKKTTKAVVAAE